jgi:hypothetical protein
LVRGDNPVTFLRQEVNGRFPVEAREILAVEQEYRFSVHTACWLDIPVCHAQILVLNLQLKKLHSVLRLRLALLRRHSRRHD